MGYQRRWLFLGIRLVWATSHVWKFRGEIRKKLEVSVPWQGFCCNTGAILKHSVMSGDVSPETEATESQNETLSLWFFLTYPSKITSAVTYLINTRNQSLLAIGMSGLAAFLRVAEDVHRALQARTRQKLALAAIWTSVQTKKHRECVWKSTWASFRLCTSFDIPGTLFKIQIALTATKGGWWFPVKLKKWVFHGELKRN